MESDVVGLVAAVLPHPLDGVPGVGWDDPFMEILAGLDPDRPADTPQRSLLSEAMRSLVRSIEPDPETAWADEPSPPPGRWTHRLLLQSERADLHRVCLAADGAIPVHDHPGTWGVMLVRSGRVRVSRFDLAAPTRAGERHCRLEPHPVTELGPGDCSHFGPGWHNLHGIEALGREVRLYNLRSLSATPTRQGLYLPLGSEELGDSVFTRIEHTTKTNATARSPFPY